MTGLFASWPIALTRETRLICARMVAVAWIQDNPRAVANRALSIRALTLQPRLTVTVVDREAMNRTWGTPSFFGVARVTVDIAPLCPECGRRRGKPTPQTFHEFGEHYSADTWTNPCGHVDQYADVLEEARELKRNLQ